MDTLINPIFYEFKYYEIFHRVKVTMNEYKEYLNARKSEYFLVYKERNKEKISEYGKKYYQDNKEKFSMYRREYYKKTYVPVPVKNAKLVQRNIEIKKLRSQGLTLQAIGNKFQITREMVRLICNKDDTP